VISWFDGIHLLGQFNEFRTGCWLYEQGGEAAILEMPPFTTEEQPPYQLAKEAVGDRVVKYLLCTHAHPDHFHPDTLDGLRTAFPDAQVLLHAGFKRWIPQAPGEWFFEEERQLTLGVESLYLVPAAKHSRSDTHVIFRGTICTGDWELGTIHSVHDGKPWGVPLDEKQRGVHRLRHWPASRGYDIHRVFSVHANDKREQVDFGALMAATMEPRKLW
jgi:hydroxyacylglutathione hydrolase